MSRRISFKLYDKDAAGNPIDELGLSLAFQRHCVRNLGVNDDLNLLVKKVWIKFLRDSVDRSASKAEDLTKAGVADAGGEAVVAGDSGTDAVAPEGVPVDALADTQAVPDQAAST